MLRNLMLMKVDLSCNVELKNNKTGDIIGKVGYFNVEGETVDIKFKDVSNFLPNEVILELPDSRKNYQLEQIFEMMFDEIMTEST